MKKLVLMLAIALGTTAVAQEKKMDRKMMSPEAKVEKMAKELDLTAEQQVKIKEIYAKKKETMKAHKLDRRLDKKEVDQKVDKAKMKEVFAKRKEDREQFDKEIKSILTPEQIEKYDAKKKKMMEKRSERFGKKAKMKEAK